ncbi:MAG: hypothetical protein CMK71_06755 [Pseudomonadaceae bacterium]|nr:hypothetical protein [Pseudomonadaceae bacterium]|tara:strand:+ start:644 stop:1828 length:1185 start_codon:yes stop_codon:yes gene_type:complete
MHRLHSKSHLYLSLATSLVIILPLEFTVAAPVTDNLDIGGAIRARFDYDPDRDIQKLSLDTIRLDVNYKSDSWIGSGSYRCYGGSYPYEYVDSICDIAFPSHAWVGYRIDQGQQVHVGLNQVPFGLQPYFGGTFFEGIGNVIGLEDVHNLGVKYIKDTPDWNLQAAYYPIDGGQGKGTSRGGKSYSTNIADADDYVVDGSDNIEKNKIALRYTRKLEISNWASEIGGSAFTSTLENQDTDKNGRRSAFAAHYSGKNGPFGVELQAARQIISPENSGSNKYITFGGYDGTFNVAAKGNLYVAHVSYDLPDNYWLISGMQIYSNYSLFDKSESAFKNSQRFIVGTSFSFKDLYIYVEWLHGKNDPYVGGSSYTDSLAMGGSDQWENQLYTNIGYYF